MTLRSSARSSVPGARSRAAAHTGTVASAALTIRAPSRTDPRTRSTPSTRRRSSHRGGRTRRGVGPGSPSGGAAGGPAVRTAVTAGFLLLQQTDAVDRADEMPRARYQDVRVQMMRYARVHAHSP